MVIRDIIRTYSGAIYRNDINEVHNVPINITGLTGINKVPSLSILIWDNINSAYRVATNADIIDNNTDFVILMESINLTSGAFSGNKLALTKASFDKKKVYFLNTSTNSFEFKPSNIVAYKHPRFKINE